MPYLLLCVLIMALLPLAPVRAEADDADAAPQPHADLTAAEVIEAQLNALILAADPDDERGMLTVWRFASPSNREATGPFENFDRMVRMGYPALVGHARHEVVDRQAVEDADVPTEMFLVKVVDSNGAEHLFAWVVSRQQGGAFDGCWMTDGVRPLDPQPLSPDGDRVV